MSFLQDVPSDLYVGCFCDKTLNIVDTDAGIVVRRVSLMSPIFLNWSPSGRRLAFAHRYCKEMGVLCLGKDRVMYWQAEAGIFHLSWHQRLALAVGNRSGASLHILDDEGKTQRSFSLKETAHDEAGGVDATSYWEGPMPWNFSWGPRGHRVAIVESSKVRIIDVSSGDSCQIYNPDYPNQALHPDRIEWCNCSWSVDETHIAIDAHRISAAWLYIVNLSAAQIIHRVQLASSGFAYCLKNEWSLDGRKVVCTLREGALNIVDLSSGKTWSPDVNPYSSHTGARNTILTAMYSPVTHHYVTTRTDDMLVIEKDTVQIVPLPVERVPAALHVRHPIRLGTHDPDKGDYWPRFCWSRDGSRVGSETVQGSLLTVDVVTGQLHLFEHGKGRLLPCAEHEYHEFREDDLRDFAWSRTSQKIATGSRDGRLRIYDSCAGFLKTEINLSSSRFLTWGPDDHYRSAHSVKEISWA